ncbi:MAG: nucleoid-associated protein [Williamsia sp.]|nr:nucleoid-associated protein [Williamsia sp.]
MIQIEEATVVQLIAHRVGPDETKVVVSSQLSEHTGAEEEETFKKILLKPFSAHTATFEFQHEIGLEYNVLFGIARSVLEEAELVENSRKIVQHLGAVSKHPQIREGDLFVAKFENVLFENKHYKALGIYKFEDKDLYIETAATDREMELNFRRGIGSRKPDKACLIIFTEEPFTLLIIDSNSRETDYWQNDFIKHKPKNDAVNNTHDFLGLTKDFITKQMPQDFQVSRADQIDLLNRSVEYFKTHETFDKGGFEEEVFHHDNLIQSFRKFDHTYKQEQGVELSDQFEISPQAVKKQARVFKSVLKLDKNFHVYIHGNRELIEQGVDEDGRKYYKIYYENES